MFNELIQVDEVRNHYGYGIISFRVGNGWGIGYTKDFNYDDDTGSTYWETLPDGEVEPVFVGFDDPDIFVRFDEQCFVMAGKSSDEWALFTDDKEPLGTFPSKEDAIAAAKALLTRVRPTPGALGAVSRSDRLLRGKPMIEGFGDRVTPA